jgi:hypothetical protein
LWYSHDLQPVEEANMTPATLSGLHLRIALIATLLGAFLLTAQEDAQKTGFYEVSLTKDDIYTYTNLKFAGDYAPEPPGVSGSICEAGDDQEPG